MRSVSGELMRFALVWGMCCWLSDELFFLNSRTINQSSQVLANFAYQIFYSRALVSWGRHNPLINMLFEKFIIF